MNPDEFEQLAWKQILSEADESESREFEALCRSDDNLRARFEQLRRDYEMTHNQLLVAFARNAEASQSNPSPETVQNFFAHRRSVEPTQERRTDKILLFRPAVWISGLAAAIVIGGTSWLIFRPSPQGSSLNVTDRTLADHKTITIPTGKMTIPSETTKGTLTPRGETQFVNPLLSWSSSLVTSGHLSVRDAKGADIASFDNASSPVPLSNILAMTGQSPQLGTSYQVVLSQDGQEIARWDFTIADNAADPAANLSDEALLSKAKQLAPAKPGEAWQYLLRVSGTAQNSPQGQEIERELRDH